MIIELKWFIAILAMIKCTIHDWASELKHITINIITTRCRRGSFVFSSWNSNESVRMSPILLYHFKILWKCFVNLLTCANVQRLAIFTATPIVCIKVNKRSYILIFGINRAEPAKQNHLNTFKAIRWRKIIMAIPLKYQIQILTNEFK